MEDKMKKLEEIEKRLEELVKAHRAVAACNEALFQTSKVLIALIPAPQPLVQYHLESLHRATMTHMDSEKLDPEYQSLVAEAFSELQAAVLSARP
jgi:hypothetical protein